MLPSHPTLNPSYPGHPMYFVILPSYPGTHRIFVAAESSPEVHAILKGVSMWGGHDKTTEFEGVSCFGYEIRNEKIGSVIDLLINSSSWVLHEG